MAEYIEREAAIRVVNRQSSLTMTRSILIDSISKLPAADVAPVVRCKDCKHYLIADEFDGGKRHICEVNHFSYLNSDGDMHFCSYGKPKKKL